MKIGVHERVLMGPGDLTLHDLGLKFSHNVLGEVDGIDMPNSAALRAAEYVMKLTQL